MVINPLGPICMRVNVAVHGHIKRPRRSDAHHLNTHSSAIDGGIHSGQTALIDLWLSLKCFVSRLNVNDILQHLRGMTVMTTWEWTVSMTMT